jgi:hypothetical protein
MKGLIEMLSKNIAPPDVCLKVYYGASMGEVGNAEIRTLFGEKIGSATITRIKKKTAERMHELNTPRIDARSVNVKVLFEVLGLDVAALERNYRKLVKLKELESKC